MRLVVVRHGRTPWNADRRFQGHADIDLDDTGRAQARALGAMLAREPFDLAVASDLSRAAETARLVLGAREVPLRLDLGWREMRFGTWEGKTWPEIVAAHPELDAANETAPRAYTPPGGETFDELVARVEAALAAVTASAGPDATVLIATHAGPLHALLRILVTGPGEEPLGVRFAPGSATAFQHDDDGRWALAMLNRTPEEPIPAS